MKILHLVESLIGGPATYFSEILHHQVLRYGKENVILICPEQHRSHVGHYGATIEYFSYDGRNLGSVLKLRSKWIEMVRDRHFDVVHLHSSFAGAIGRAMFWPKETAIVYCPHGWSFHGIHATAKRLTYIAVEYILSFRSHATIAVSRAELSGAQALRIPSGKMHLIYNGISDTAPPQMPASARSDAVKILFVGRLDHQKGVDILLAVARALDPEKFTIKIVGASVITDTQVGSAPSHVEFLGWLNPDDVRVEILECDMLVVPSRWEAFGFVAVEAMRDQKAVVASNVGGLSEVVEHGVTGVLFEPGSELALEEAIYNALDIGIEELGQRGRKRFQELFVAKNTFERTDALYQELIRRD